MLLRRQDREYRTIGAESRVRRCEYIDVHCAARDNVGCHNIEKENAYADAELEAADQEAR